MRNVGIWRLLSLGVVLCAGCGGSTSNKASNDGGGPSGSSSSADSGGTSAPAPSGAGALPMINATCGFLASLGGLAGGGGGGGGADAGAMNCPQGQACCTMLMAFSASCVPVGQCSGGMSNQCTTGSDCAAGQVCCSGSADGGAAAGAGGFGGFGGFGGNLFGDTTCQSSCTPAQTQNCTSSSECPSGTTCQPPNLGGFGGFGGFGGGGEGGAGAGGFGLMIPNQCMPPAMDAGAMGTAADAGGGD
ncbi:MAG TPA: hypothetical protein VKU41_08205 [Polyangiaceae bacterium]|nr:hypothetical protein [Polyangiaceae bacterium]